MQTLTETEPLLSTASRQSEAEIEASPQEGSNRHASHLNLKLFFSLLADSIPGQRPLIIWQNVDNPHRSVSVILSYTLQNSVQTVSIAIVGRIGPDELSAAAFSLMLAFVTGAWWCYSD